MNTITFSNKFDHPTTFARSEAAIWLTELWGMKCGLNGQDSGPFNTRGLCVLETNEQCYEGEDFHLVETQLEDGCMNLCWKVGATGLLWRSLWQVQPETGIWSRRDQLENITRLPIEIRRCLARLPFSPGKYEAYTQSSNWARENQGHWNEFFAGRLSLGSFSGRTTQIANPYLFIRESGADHGIALHILPRGNWVIHIDRMSTTRDEFSPFNIVELGLSDNALQLKLEPGNTLELPEILIQDIPSNQPEVGSALLHYYLLDKYFAGQKTAPIVYNTWFDNFDSLDIQRLRAQLTIAQKIGCEIFTVDAGWYGRGKGDWHRQVGDWREKLDSAFRGQLTTFAKEVRAAGMGFGLWVEPERNSPDAPIVQAHPQWFLPGLGGFFYPDLSQPAVYEYIFSELSRLIETYQLAWIKVDFNFELGHSADQFYGYFKYWYQLIDALRAKYPSTFFEGCASGGMRLDLNTLRHFDANFLSDTVNPIDVLRITQGAMLRLPPGRLIKWAVLRAHHNQIITPGGGSWDHAMLADVDFICRAALPGMFGLSGDLLELSEETLARLQVHIAFSKEWRGFIQGAVCHLLTPIGSLANREGWIAFQFQNSTRSATSLLFVYRLSDGLSSKSFHLQDVDKAQTYSVINIDAWDSLQTVSGFDLIVLGLNIDLSRSNSAAIYVIQAIYK